MVIPVIIILGRHMPNFAISIFLSAFLLFQMQPLVGKFLLPRFGGTPSVWAVCMFFFQVVLVLGYSYSHWLARALNPHSTNPTACLLYGFLWGTGAYETSSGSLDLFLPGNRSRRTLSGAVVSLVAPWISF